MLVSRCIASTVLLILLLTTASARAAVDRGPNVVFILADDFGWRDLRCYGSTYFQTPNLDKLASRGVRFTQAYAANPLCSPTRSSILTGLWPARTGITAPVCHEPKVILKKGLAKGNPRQRVLVAESLTRLKTDYVTLPKVLHDAGYNTGHFGKWHLGAEPYSPLQQGYDVDWPHWSGPGPAGSYVAPWRFPPALGVSGQPGEHIEDTLSQHVVDYIHQNRDHPFFVSYWQFSVHAPYDAKDELVAKYRKLIDPRNAQRNPVYAAMVESLDDGVGRVMHALEQDGLLDNTIIVFFSDNGGVSWGGVDSDTEGAHVEHKSARFQADMHWPPTSNLPLRNGKASLYEGGTREPCMVVWPGVTKPGTTNDTVIQSIDWMPTLLEMVGVPLPTAARPDGISIVPAIKGGTLARDAIFCHFPHDTPASGQHPGTYVRRGDWKLIRLFAANADGSDKLELYNLKADLGEIKNLAAEKPELVRELNELIGGFLKESDAVIPKLNPSYDPARVPAAQGGGDAKPSDASKTPTQGWTQRQCVATVKDGALVVTGKGANPFLGIGAGTKGPGEVIVRARCDAGGDGKVEWLVGGKTPGEPKSVPFKLAGGGEWQDVSVQLPADATIGILRVYLPAQSQEVAVQSIELKTPEKPRRWEFK
jgi:arylsulfatase A-like enzyme